MKLKSDFRDLVKNGRRAKAANWLTIDYIIDRRDDEISGSILLGLSISRKMGSAVVRNKLKRWCREFFRKVAKEADLNGSGVKLNLRLRENGDFYKNIPHSEFDGALERAWLQIKKNF